MRIDELDSKHKEFKEVILDHELTEEQLDEILPAIIGGLGLAARAGLGAVGTVARVGAQAAGAVARGVGSAAGAVARGVGNIATQAGRTASRTTKKAGQNMAKNYAKDTAKKLSSQGTQGTQGTIGTDPSENPGANLQRGMDITIPIVDPKKPDKAQQTPMQVKSVTGQEIELINKKHKPGQPKTIKFDKKDLAF